MATLLVTARKSIWLGWLLDNPLLVREMRRRMRGRLFTWSLIGYLVALGVVSCMLMITSYPLDSTARSAREMIQDVGKIGSTLFMGIVFVEGFIALFIAPLLTAGLATQEKEKDTFDFLRVTTLRSRTFVAGCLLTTACFLMLVFTCTLPILGLTFIFGGVSMGNILLFNLTLFFAAMVISAWGIFNSTTYQRSRAVHFGIFIVIMLVVFFGLRFGFVRRWFSSSFVSVSTGLGRHLVFVIAPMALLIAIFSTAAVRRLYEPNNRMFNYKQFTIFFVGLLGALGGRMAYLMSGLNPLLPDPREISLLMGWYFGVGGFLTVAAIMLFCTSRIEKGSEIWRLRLRFPVFRRFDESIIFLALYAALWLAPGYFMARAWDTQNFFAPRILHSIPVLLVSLFTIWALANLISAFGENSNRVAMAIVLLLVVLWGAVPAMGFFVAEISPAPGDSASPLSAQVSTVMLNASPAPLLIAIWDDDVREYYLFPILMVLAQGFVFLLPFISKSIRARFKVSYHLTPPGGPAPSPSPDPIPS